jgi:hypothetical protein
VAFGDGNAIVLVCPASIAVDNHSDVTRGRRPAQLIRESTRVQPVEG